MCGCPNSNGDDGERWTVGSEAWGPGRNTVTGDEAGGRLLGGFQRVAQPGFFIRPGGMGPAGTIPGRVEGTPPPGEGGPGGP